MATSSASSSSHSLTSSPKDLLLLLNILNRKQKRKYEEVRDEDKQQQEQNYQHHPYYRQYIDQQEHKQQQTEENKWEGEEKQFQQYVELSQIELIYRAEGNANVVLALPQFKRVLRLPKIFKQHEQSHLEHKTQYQEIPCYENNLPKEQPKQQDEMNQQEPNKISNIDKQENKNDDVGILTMDHYVAYISIIRCLVGNEFVFEADVVAVPNPTDRDWINDHIKPYRPANRLDKEFGGHFGLLLPDATQLPEEFDVLFPNLQSVTPSTATNRPHCSNKSGTDSSTPSISNNIFGSDAYAIEIKPKQGWLLPNDVNNLFDIKPKITQTTRITRPPSLRETKKASKAAVPTTTTTIRVPTETETKPLKTSTDIEYFTTTQNEPSQTIAAARTSAAARASTPSPTEVPITSPCCSNNMSKTSETPTDDKISHSLYDKVDTRCRYCSMQFLKMKQKKIVKRNNYCPMDLFSGCTEKMLFALQALFECPQNNLRIFQNGNLVFDNEKSQTIHIGDLFSSDKLQLIKHLLVTCLLREYEHKNNEGAKNEAKEQIDQDSKQVPLSTTIGGVQGDNGRDEDGSRTGIGISACSGAGAGAGAAAGQPHSSVTSCKKQKFNTMPKIISTTTTTTTTTRSILTETEVTKVKSTLTSANPVISMGKTLTSASDYSTQCLEQINEAEVTCLPKNCVLQKILQLQLLAKNHLQFMLDHEYSERSEKTFTIVNKLLEKFKANPHNELTLCQLSPEEQYILAATYMDCSIMITFCEIGKVFEDEKLTAEKRHYVVSTLGRKFLTKVTLLDLDPKSDAHFHKYFQQTKEIFDAMKEL